MCKHPNVSIREYGVAYTLHEFLDGKPSYNLGGFDNYTGHCTASCPDCGFQLSFNRRSKRLPKWLQRCLEQLEPNLS